MLLQMNEIMKRFGATVVLDGVSLVARASDRIGIIGTNGTGKSTLLKIAAGRLSCDGGEVQYAPAAEIGYVPQTVDFRPGQTIAHLLAESRQRLAVLEERMHALADQMATTSGTAQATLLAAYGDAAAQFEQAGGYDLDYQIGLVLEGLRLRHLAPHRPLATLSSGERTRVALATLLLSAPDVLLLDEPTNHLDAATADWLEAYLVQQTGAVIIVSHDRQFLDRVATQIGDLDEHTHHLTRYGGSYADYVTQKQRERHAWEAAYARQQQEIAALRQQATQTPQRLGTTRARRDGDKLTYNFKGERVQSSIARDVRNAEQRLERIQADPIPRPPRPLRFCGSFAPAAHGSGTVLSVTHLSKAFAPQSPILHDISLELGTADRVVLVGDNGAGKSTLLRILMGDVAPDDGQVAWTKQAVVAYLAQEDTVPTNDRTVLQVYRAGRIGYTEEHQSDLLATGLFRPNDIQKPVRALSVGQRRKLALALLLATPANVLLLDEPTNQLSLDVVEQLETALDSFPGAVLAVSHDRRFISRFRGEQWRLIDGRIQHEPPVLQNREA
jgi:macrolide transport system ATP-binding/permease protein